MEGGLPRGEGRRVEKRRRGRSLSARGFGSTYRKQKVLQADPSSAAETGWDGGGVGGTTAGEFPGQSECGV